MNKNIFDEDSVIDEETNIESFVPPYPGWNFVKLIYHPEDLFNYNRMSSSGKWLLFVPNKDFIQVFRKLSKLAKDFKLTHCFKASGEPGNNGEHVFCIYVTDYKKIGFVRKIGDVLLGEGLIEEYGYKYKNGTKAVFFKTDDTTHYKSNASGKSLTLFSYNDKKELFVKEFHDGKPSWKKIDNDNEKELTENFEDYLLYLENKDLFDEDE